MSSLALPRTISDMIDEYDTKNAAIETEIAALRAAIDRLKMSATVGGAFAGTIINREPYLSASDLRAKLLKSGWRAVYDRLQIDRLAPASDKRLFERSIADPPALTAENVRATFGMYFEDPRFHILRGLAECFVGLNPAYRSHSKVKIGVAGLPKRLILTSMRGYGSYGRDKLRDVLNALAAYRGKPLLEHAEFADLERLCSSFGNKRGTAVIRGIDVRTFENGNAHVIFDRESLLDINRGLAEFYGDVLPDAEERCVKPRASTEVAKSLQFYPTPAEVVRTVLDEAGLIGPQEGYRDRFVSMRVLEPSCGDGRMMDEIRARGHRVLGIEVDIARANQAKAKGHAVHVANFLDQPADATFDFVVMNPPFYGRHYAKHVRHAFAFLKPGGTLAAILPASERYDHRELKDMGGSWEDLPVASFRESGTNIPTGYLIISKRA